MTSAARAAWARLDAPWRVPLVAWAGSRALILAAALVAGLLFGEPTRGVDPAVSGALAPLGGWDTTWYLDVARNGYAHDIGQVGLVYTNLAFFPALPAAMALFLALGLNPFVGALVLSNLAFLAALAALHRLSADRMGERLADRVTWVVALAPPAVYCSLAYTEGIALACAVGAALLAVRGRYLPAGVVAGAAVLTRPTGILVALLVGLLALADPAPGRLRRAALAVAPSVVALAAFLGWMAVARGSALLPFEAQGAWDRGSVGIGFLTDGPTEIAAAWDLVARGDLTAAWTATIRDVGFLVLYAWLLVLLARGVGWRSPWFLYSLAALAIPLSSGTTSSIARFGLMAFPLAWPMAEWLERHPGRVRLVAGAAILAIVLMVGQLEMRAP